VSQKYSYAVAAVAADGQQSDLSAAAVEASTFQPLSPACKTVTNSALFRHEKINVVSWKRNPLNSAITVLQYNIYRKLSIQGDSQYQMIGSVGAGVLEYLDRKLATTDTFYYYVTTVDTGNTESKPSAVAREGV
jgi:fibronectin type 3 domain-containing protein